MYLGVECKSLSPEAPLIVSRVPRPARESRHDVIRRFLRPEHGDVSFAIEQSGIDHLRLYSTAEPVGKSTIRWDGTKKIAVPDDTYDKWAQALASAAELVETAAHSAAEAKPIFEFVMPVLLINDGALWVVDYAEDGTRAAPALAQETTLFVDRKHEVQGRYGPQTYHLSHLHIHTRTSFLRMLENLAGRLHERIFGWILRIADEKGWL
jgi:hypothetical protein